MWLVKSLSNNAAVATGADGGQMVVLGKGIGFPKMPYELTDPTSVQRTFYDVDPRLADIIAGIPEHIIMVSVAIVEMAERELEQALNPNSVFTFADHLHFVLLRLEKGISIEMPLAYDIEHLYPRESSVARRAIELIERELIVSLPATETTSVTLHIINGQDSAGDMRATMIVGQVAQFLTATIEERMGISLDQSSFEFSRFLLHLRYLVGRLSTDRQMDKGSEELLQNMALVNPDVYECTIAATDYLTAEWGWKCNREETMYLMMHVYRVCR